MSAEAGRPRLATGTAEGSDYAGSVGASVSRMTPQALPAEAVPAQPATRDGLSDHEWLRRAAMRSGLVTAYLVVVSAPGRQTRRESVLTLNAARNAARRARSRGWDVEVRLVALLTLADVPEGVR